MIRKTIRWVLCNRQTTCLKQYAVCLTNSLKWKSAQRRRCTIHRNKLQEMLCNSCVLFLEEVSHCFWYFKFICVFWIQFGFFKWHLIFKYSWNLLCSACCTSFECMCFWTSNFEHISTNEMSKLKFLINC